MLGALGVYRAAFVTIAQTERLADRKVTVPVVGIGGELSIGAGVAAMLESVGEDVTEIVLPGCGHFVPEERPEAVVEQILAVVGQG